MRTCEKCGERKKLSAFAKDKKAPSGRRHVCRVCVRKNAAATAAEGEAQPVADVQ